MLYIKKMYTDDKVDKVGNLTRTNKIVRNNINNLNANLSICNKIDRASEQKNDRRLKRRNGDHI